MSLLFGIIDLHGNTNIGYNLGILSKSICPEGAVIQLHHSESFGIGYGHSPDREPRAEIYSDKRLTVLADLRLFNKEELRDIFHFESDAQALAKAYLLWGTSCASRLNGEYAAVIIDHVQNKIFLLRDHIGTRPLVYCICENHLYFSSDEFGLIKSGLIPTELCESKLISNFFGFDGAYVKTMFNGVHKVLPGHIHAFKGDDNKSICWWNPKKLGKDNTITYEQAVLSLRKLLVHAVLKRMEPCKTGLHVSGGIDSCGIASIVTDHTSDKSTLFGYSWSPKSVDNPIPGVNEIPFIEAFIQEKGVPVHFLKVEPDEVAQNTILPEFETQHIELPIMQQAHKDGVHLMFSGWGGDELVTLSIRGIINHLFFRWKFYDLIRYSKAFGLRNLAGRFRREVLPSLIPFHLILPYQSQSVDWSKLRLFKTSFLLKHWKLFLFRKRNQLYGCGGRSNLMINLVNQGHLPERMDSWTINAEKYGFIYTYPLLDKDVVEFILRLPDAYSYRDFVSRKLYRDAMQGLMPEIIRTRMDKSESYRMTYSIGLRQQGKEFLEKEFFALSPTEHLPFCNLKNWNKLIRKPLQKGISLHNFREITKLCHYLRYANLVKKYG